MDFKKREETKSIEIKVQNGTEEQAVNKQHQMLEQQQEELPADKLLKERKTMPDIGNIKPEEYEESELDQIKGRQSWQETSMTGEQRKAILKSGKPMPQKMKEQYIEEYQEAQQQKQHEQKRFADIRRKAHSVEQENKKPRTLNQIRMDIWQNGILDDVFDTMREIENDKEEASESFSQMVLQTKSMLSMFNKAEDVSTSDYQDAFAKAQKAVEFYLESHSGHRWTEKGKRRKSLAKQMKAQLEAVQMPVLYMLLEAKKEEMNSYEDNISCLNKKEEVSSHIINGFPEEYTSEQVEELAKSGTLHEKIKAMFEMNMIDYYQNAYQEEVKKTGNRYDKKQFISKYEMIQNTIIKASPMEQLNAVDAVIGMQTILTEKIMREYIRFFNEAPDGADPEAYAILKLQYNPLYAQQMALNSIVTSVSGESKVDEIYDAMTKLPKLRVEGMPDPEQTQSVMKKIFKTHPTDYILAVGSDIYRQIAGESQTNEMNTLLKSNLVSKEKKSKKQDARVEELLKKKHENMIFSALKKNTPMDMSEEHLKESRDSLGSLYGVNYYDVSRFVLTEKGMSEMMKKTDEAISNRMKYLAFFQPLKETLLPQYAEKIDEIWDSFAQASGEEKLEMAKGLFYKQLMLLKADWSEGSEADDTDKMMLAAQEICMQHFKEKLREIVPEVVELSEQYLDSYLKDKEELLSEKAEIMKEFSMSYEDALKTLFIREDKTKVINRKGALTASSNKHLMNTIKTNEGEMKTKILVPIHKLAKKVASFQLVTPEKVREMSTEKMVEYSKLMVGMKVEMQKLEEREAELNKRNRLGVLSENSQEAMELSDIQMYDEEMCEFLNNYISHMQRMMFLDLENYQVRIPKDEEYQRKLMEEKEFILSRDEEDFTEDKVKEIIEKGSNAQVLSVIIKLNRLMERGTRFYAGSKESTIIPMKSREAIFNNAMVQEIDRLIEERMIKGNQQDLYEMMALIEKVKQDVESKAIQEFEKHKKTAPEGVDAELYATLKMFFSPVGQDYEALSRFAATLSSYGGNGFAQIDALYNVIREGAQKITGADISILEKACRKLPKEIVQSVIEENKWEEQRKEFNEKHGRYIVSNKNANA